MLRLSFTAGLIVAFLIVSQAHHLAAAERPNFVLIFADDLGWQECGFTGSDFNETPHLDRLAKQGMVFTQAYAAAGNCAPSRACLLSGQYTPRHDVYAVGTTNRGPAELMRLIPVKNNSGLGASEFTLPKALESAGYATGMFGKWHLDGSEGSKPDDHFDVVKVAGHSWKGADEDDPKGVFSIATAACDFIEKNRSRPFFAYLPHYAIHSGLQSRKQVLDKFQQKPPGERHRNPASAACLAELDESVGIVLKKLDDLGLARNTLVVFTSDNGGTAESQEPLRGKKGCYYEGGIREPMIVRWPAVVQPATTCHAPVINVDFYATFAAIAGAKLPNDRPLDGTNLLPLFRGETKLDRQAIFWHFPGYLDGPVPRGRDPVFRTRPVSVMRQGDWKLHLFHEEWRLDGGRAKIAENSAVELYNVSADPGERRNLAASETHRRDQLLNALLEWIEHVPAPLPSELNPRWNPNATPAKKKK